jgi:uncharacterized protein
VLLVMVGLTGTGKSTVARALGQVMGAKVISADATRKAKAGLGERARSETAPDSGIYSPEMNTRVYQSLLGSARARIAIGRHVVLDATFRRKADREAVSSLAASLGARLLFVQCQADDAVVRARLEERQRVGDPWSDGRWEIYLQQQATFEPLTPDERLAAAPVCTEAPLLDQVRAVLSALETR